MFKKLFLSILLVGVSSTQASANEQQLNSADSFASEIAESLTQEEMQAVENLEMELQSRRGDILRDILIDELLPKRRRGKVVCYASNRRGISYKAVGKHPRIAQQRALRKCDNNSRRRCFADGCRRIRDDRRYPRQPRHPRHPRQPRHPR